MRARDAALILLLATSVPATLPAQDEVAAPAMDAEAVARGEYVFHAAGCEGCHTAKGDDAGFLAGGRALVTPFGTFYSPNITPDEATGIGGWTYQDFRRAVREGVLPDGSAMFPVFPYLSYTGMNEQDLGDLWAYLRSVPAIERTNTAHDAPAPFGWRALLPVWRGLYFDEGPTEAPVGMAPEWYRGAYLVRAVAHCGECHTPRDWLGGLDGSRELAGNPQAPEGDGSIPNITPHEDGLGGWSAGDIDAFLTDGITPDGDFAGGAMAEVIRNSTSRMTEDDRRAIILYLRSLPALPDED